MAVHDAQSAEEKRQSTELSLCVTLVSLFDFEALGEVSRKDWERGTSTLLLGELGKDQDLWERMLGQYDPEKRGAVQLDKVRDVLPIDPRISVLLQQLVHAVAGCREFVAGATNKMVKDIESRTNRALINIRKKICNPVFYAWLDVHRTDRKLRTRAARHMKLSGLGRLWRTWRASTEGASERAARLGKMARRMMNRSAARALDAWVAAADEVRRMRKLVCRARSPATRAWNHWASLAAEGRRLRAMLRRGMDGGLSRGFNTWRERVQLDKDADTKCAPPLRTHESSCPRSPPSPVHVHVHVHVHVECVCACACACACARACACACACRTRARRPCVPIVTSVCAIVISGDGGSARACSVAPSRARGTAGSNTTRSKRGSAALHAACSTADSAVRGRHGGR